MKIKSTLLIVFFICSLGLSAQYFSLKRTDWTLGLSSHIVVDGGKEMNFPFQTKAWNFVPYPSRLTAEAYLVKGWSVQTELAYTQYKVGNILDNVATTKSGTYLGFDANAKFAMSHWTKKRGWFDPYLTFGYGYTMRSLAKNVHTGNSNLGLGCNFWIYEGFGLNLQGLGKFAWKGGTKSNYSHYSVALVYKFKP